MMHPSPFDLEAFSAAPRPAADIDVHVQGCATCRAYVDELKRLQTNLLTAQPAAAFALRVAQKASIRSRPVWFGWAVAATLAASAGAIALVVKPPDPQDTLRTMGDTDALLFLRRGEDLHVVGAVAEVRPGDALQIVLRLQRPMYVSVFFLDDSGAVSWLVPSAAEGLALRVGSGEWTAPVSAVFDASKRPERVIVVRREGPFKPVDIATHIRERLPQQRDAFESGAWLRDVTDITSALFTKP